MRAALAKIQQKSSLQVVYNSCGINIRLNKNYPSSFIYASFIYNHYRKYSTKSNEPSNIDNKLITTHEVNKVEKITIPLPKNIQIYHNSITG